MHQVIVVKLSDYIVGDNIKLLCHHKKSLKQKRDGTQTKMICEKSLLPVCVYMTDRLQVRL